MANLPYRRAAEPAGIEQVCTTANTDYAIAVPNGAKGAVIGFVTSATSDTLIWGRVSIDDTSTGVAVNASSFGHQGPSVETYELDTQLAKSGGAYSQKPLYIHVANATAGAVCKGMWLYRSDKR